MIAEPYSYQAASAVLRENTAIVVPVCFPPHIDAAEGARVLRDTLAACRDQVSAPAVCLSVDGADCGAAVAEPLAREFGATLMVGAKNRGKFMAVANGVARMDQNAGWRYVAVVDQDGDHFLNELLNFVRAAEHIRAHTGLERILVLGRRISRHRPMGLLRGELEELADRVLLDALTYHSFAAKQPLRLEYAFMHDEFPDFHSGYKLFSRQTAGEVFLCEPNLCGVPEACYYRHGVEAVMTVEAMIRGAYLGVVNRSTLNEQPFSTFGVLERCQLVADKMIWPLRRLNVPPAFVRQWLANPLARLLLGTLLPQGKEELQRIAELTLQGCVADPAAAADFLQPLFL